MRNFDVIKELNSLSQHVRKGYLSHIPAHKCSLVRAFVMCRHVLTTLGKLQTKHACLLHKLGAAHAHLNHLFGTPAPFKFFFSFVKAIHQDPVVQSAVSLTSSLLVISLTVLADSIYNILIFFAEKMWVAFAHFFFSKQISAYLRITL